MTIFTGTSDIKNYTELLKEATEQPTLTGNKPSSSWLRMNELQLEIQRLKSDVDARNAYIRNLERGNANATSVALENQELRKKLNERTKSLETKRTELNTLRSNIASFAEAAEEAASMRVQMETFEESNKKLRETVAKHTAQANDIARLQASVSDLQVKLNTEENTNKQLTPKLSEHADTIKDITGVSDVLRSQNRRLVSKVNELQKKFDAAENARDLHGKEHAKTLELYNASKQENNKLREENRAITEKLSAQLRYFGFFVTELDLVAERIRIYVCPHGRLQTIYPATPKTTQKKSVFIVADDMYKQWKDEREFLKEYEAVRQDILDHHRAHEKAMHKKGHRSENIKAAFENLDEKRRLCIKYNKAAEGGGGGLRQTREIC